jgi:3',5'-cyclic AMP phosphodiesterase CpdA
MKRMPMLAVLMLALALINPVLSAQKDVTGVTAVPDHIILSLIGDPSTTQTITWRTDTTVASGIVQYHPNTASSEQAKTMAATYADLTSVQGTARIFTATLSNLVPGTRYIYNVGDGRNWSEPHEFSTADPKPSEFKFLLFGDSQSGIPYNTWRTTLQNAYAANRDAKFMAFTGDIVDAGRRWEQWNAWFDAGQGIIDLIPVVPALGNHEVYENNFKPFYWFTVPQNGPEGLKGQAYSFDYGPVHFVVLDSQVREEGEWILDVQKRWLDADLSASKAVWKIALFHKSPYQVYASRPNKDIRAAFCPIFDKYHVDAVFNGHDHCIARTYTIAGDSIVKKPSQGTVYFITGRSGTKAYPNSVVKKDDALDAFFLNPLSQPNYMVVGVSKTMLTVTAFNQDGTLVDTFFIDKVKDTSSYTQSGSNETNPAPFGVIVGSGMRIVAEARLVRVDR